MHASIRLLIAVPMVGLFGACADAADPSEGAEAASPAPSVGVARSELRVVDDQTGLGAGLDSPPEAAPDPVRAPVVAAPVIDDPVLVLAVPDAAPDADLRPDGSIRYIDFGDASVVDLQINVVNIGTTATPPSAAGRVMIANRIYSGNLYHYYDGSTTNDSVQPRQRGYIKISNYPRGPEVQPCSAVQLEIDLDSTLQTRPNARANDVRSVLFYVTGSTCPLTWTNAINAATAGVEPNPVQNPGEDQPSGKSLQEIVSSLEIGRGDGNRCSACHYSGGPYPYAPDVAQNTASQTPIDPFQPVSQGQAWITTSKPWISRFLAQPDSGSVGAKPPYLKNLFRKWLLDGVQP
jgi:hypothetical protein